MIELIKVNEDSESASSSKECYCGQCSTHSKYILNITEVTDGYDDWTSKLTPVGCCGSCMHHDIMEEIFYNYLTVERGGNLDSFPENIPLENATYLFDIWLDCYDDDCDIELGEVVKL